MASVEYGNEDVVNASLEEALSWCTRYDCEPDKEMVIKTVFVALETASKMVCEPGKRRKPCNPICLDKFKGLFDYYNAKLCSDPRNVAEFMHKVLPGIIRLALNDCGETNILPRNIQDDRYLSASKTNCKVTVYEVNITREKIAVALARIFLCLVVPSQDEQFHCKPDCSRFFTRLDGTYRNSQEGKYLMFLQYFKHILKNGVPDGCVCYSKLIGKSPGYVPSRIMQWADSECCLCDFSVKTCGSIDERPSQVMQTDFANCYFGGSTLGGGAVQEEIMLCACPELIVAMLFVSRIRSLEAVQIKGYERFSCYTGYGARLRFAGPYVESQSSACNRRPSYMTAIDAYALHSNPELQYELDYVHRELNKALVGFTQAHSQANDNLNVPAVSTKRRSTSGDLSAINKYAEALTEKLMSDIVSGLQLVIPDYFGFNVIHYDPLKEEPMATNETDSPERPSCVESSGPETTVLINDVSSIAHNSSRTRSTDALSSQSNDNIPREDKSISHKLAEYANDLSGQIVKETIDTLHKIASKPPAVTARGDSSVRPKLEVTAKTSNSAIQLSVDVDVSVTRGSRSMVAIPQSSQSIPMEVEISAAAGDSHHIDVTTDISNKPAPNIDVQIVVTPDSSSFAVANPAACGGQVTLDSKSPAASGGQVTLDSHLSSLSVSDSIKHELSQRAQRMATDILSSVYEELRERRRLLIENNISSVDFNAAKAMSAGVIGQIFEELQAEAENSIPDSEKLLKDSRVEGTAGTPPTSPIVESPGEQSSQTFSHDAASSCSLQSMFSPCIASQRSQSTLSPGAYKGWNSQRKLNRRSSAPVAVRRTSLEPITRRVSEPNVSFRSKSPHSDFEAKLSDYIRQEFCNDRRGASNSSLSSSGSKSVADHLWAEFNRRGSEDTKAAALSPSSRSPKSDSRSQSSHHTLPSCEEEDMTISADGLLLAVGNSSVIQRQVSQVLPAITVDGAGAERGSSCSSTSQEAAESNVRFDLSSQDSDRNSPLLSPLQHQYLRLYSEVLAENIVHESLGSMQQSINLSQSSRLAEVAEEEEETVEDGSNVPTNCFRPVATGNWGCGAFGGDPQLKSLIQWIAASRARCPEIIYYTFNDSRVSELVQIVRLLQSKTVSEVMCLIMGYCQARAESCGVRSLFEYIKDKEGGY